MKNFTQQEVQVLWQALECLGKTNGMKFFGTCSALGNKLIAEFNAEQKAKYEAAKVTSLPVVELTKADLAPVASAESTTDSDSAAAN